MARQGKYILRLVSCNLFTQAKSRILFLNMIEYHE